MTPDATLSQGSCVATTLTYGEATGSTEKGVQSIVITAMSFQLC